MEISRSLAQERYPEISEAVIGSLYRYVENRIPTGDFLRAVLSNDLRESFARADIQNRAALYHIVAFIHCEVPAVAWGTPDKVKGWLSKRDE